MRIKTPSYTDILACARTALRALIQHEPSPSVRGLMQAASRALSKVQLELTAQQYPRAFAAKATEAQRRNDEARKFLQRCQRSSSKSLERTAQRGIRNMSNRSAAKEKERKASMLRILRSHSTDPRNDPKAAQRANERTERRRSQVERLHRRMGHQ